jgi:hypothetical protein
VALNFSERPQRREVPGLEQLVELRPLGYSVVGSDGSDAFVTKI